ncbi:MAG: rhodanese-like domain-containing protein [Chromatiales bacterium]|jgi:rhodanese-related sulfurtransferase|nr:rhodanese-like domain-containing protein [Chromatiales bacterium]
MDNVSPKGLPPRHAWQLVQENPRALLIDIRSNMEHLFIGHPVGSVHIPWIDEPDWTVNPHFVTEVRKLLLGGIACHGEGCAPIVLICRSGKRSIEAGEALIRAGFGEVYYVEEGFEGELDAQHHRSTSGGWRFHGLPWEQC